MAAQPQKPIAHEPTRQHPPDPRSHPVKPRRSLKSPKTSQEEEQRNQTVMKRVSPAASPTQLWFERSQLPRLRQPRQELPCWLHGSTTRREAEELLKGKPQGCFLLRLSETHTGFVLSYRGRDRCRHFIIEEEGRNYLIAGEEIRHASLQELVSFYTQNSIGPFDEMLTSPFIKSRDVYDDARKLKDEDGRDATMLHETPLSSPSKPVGPESDRTPEYAVVKKALKKSYSLPEHQLGVHILSSREEEFNIPHLLTQDDSVKADNSRAGLHKSDNHIADAQYAKVIKPARTTSQGNESPYVNINTLPQQQGATEASVSSTGGRSAEDLGYWGLEPPHTYEEETPYRDQQESREEIGFYAVGRWRDIEGNAARLQHHLYSEVNLRGTRGGPAHRAAPSLPSRPPPPTAVNCPQLDAQRCEDPLMPSPSRRAFPPKHPWQSFTTDSPTIIYEEIPEMSAGSKPPLPPPNPKHSL